ncbi:MAG: efflux RND transporter periplasmic adaptor subunit [Chloroflexi bacterium]|nr:efflux RND transporter periplasmic adaptor subunit [Chloroflexota bacterium]
MRKSLIIGGWILLALLSAATFMLLNWEQPNANAASNEGAPPVASLPAISADAPAIETRARVVPAQTVELSFPNKGIGDGVMVQDVLVREGAVVKKGDALAQLDARDVQLRVENAQAALAQAQAEHQQLTADVSADKLRSDAELATLQAEAEAARLRAAADAAKLRADAAQARAEGRTTVATTLENSAASVVQAAAVLEANAKANQEQSAQLTAALESSRAATIAAAQAKVQQAEATLKREQLALDLTTLRAPIDGTVINVNITAGEISGVIDPAITIADVSSWQVESSSLLDRNVAQLREGDPATITFDALPDLTLPGKVSRIKPTTGDAGATESTFIVIVVPDSQDERVRWNMAASVSIGAQ